MYLLSEKNDMGPVELFVIPIVSMSRCSCIVGQF